MPTNYPVIDFGNNNKIYFTASPVVSEINEKQLNVIFHGKDNHLFIPTPTMVSAKPFNHWRAQKNLAG